MKVDFSKTIKSLKGKEVKDEDDVAITQADIVANILATVKATGKYKLGILAQNIQDNKTVDLDKADIALVRKSIEESQAYNNVWVSQIMDSLEEAENPTKNKDENPEKEELSTVDGAEKQG